MYDVSYTWTLKKANKKTKLIESENRLVVARGRGWEVGEMGKGESEGKKNRGMDKEDEVYIYNGMLLSH